MEDNIKKEKIEENKEEKKEKNKKRRRKVRKIIVDIIIGLIFIFIIFETVIGMINMQKINNEEKPVWYISKKVETNNLKTETTYNLGLYKIVKTDTAKKTTTTLKPFFY